MLETFGLSNIAPQVGKGFNRYVQQRVTIWVPYTPRTMKLSCSFYTPCSSIEGQKSTLYFSWETFCIHDSFASCAPYSCLLMLQHMEVKL